MKRFTLTAILSLGLLLNSLPMGFAAAKAGASCKTQGVTATVKNYKYTYSFNKQFQKLIKFDKIRIGKILEISSNKIIIYSQFRGVSNYIKSII